MMSDDEAGDDRLSRTASARPPVRRGGRALAVFATLLALAALGVAGYPYYQRITGGGTTETNGQLEGLRLAQQRQAEDLKRVVDSAADFDARLNRLQAGIENQQQVAIEANKASSHTPSESAERPSPLPDRALKLGEAEYLLQSANDRLLVTHDVRAALAMLLAAQALVDQVDDHALADVRSALSNDVASLRDATVVDVDQTFQRLQAMSRALPELPARGVRFASAPASAVPTDTPPASAWTLAWRKFLSLFEFRRQGAAARPPLGPDEATYLRLNLGLMVQAAELALIRNDVIVYQQNLESIRRWLDDYLDTSAQDVVNARGEIDQLLAVRLDRTPPDINGSLTALRRVVAPAASTPPSAPIATGDSP